MADEEEPITKDDEAVFWQQHNGETECFGTIAKLCLLVGILVQSISTFS